MFYRDPLKSAAFEESSRRLIQIITVFITVMFLSLLMGVVGAFIAPDVVTDQQTGCKALLRISNISFQLYWGSYTKFPAIVTWLPICITTIIAAVWFGPEVVRQTTPGMTLFWIFMLTHMAYLTLFVYNCSSSFKRRDSALTFQILVNVFLAMFGYVLSIALPLLEESYDVYFLQTIGHVLVPTFNFCVGVKEFMLQYSSYMLEKGNNASDLEFHDYFVQEKDDVWSPVFWSMLFSFIHLVVRLVTLWLNECWSTLPLTALCRPNHEPLEQQSWQYDDDDVKNEANLSDKATEKLLVATNNQKTSLPVLTVSHLWKSYGLFQKKPPVVRNVSFRVMPNEVFGLLGPNGAGKTSTIGVIVGQHPATAGRVLVNEYDINSQGSKACASFRILSAV